MASKRGFGNIRRLPSGRYQARYTGPDLIEHAGPTTFALKGDAEQWLGDQRREIEAGEWRPWEVKRAAVVTLADYSALWLAQRTLKPRSREGYARHLAREINPALGSLPVQAITPLAVRAWYAGLPADRPTQRAHVYSILRTVLMTAVEDGLLPANPCHIRGAGNAARARKVKPATLAELTALVDAMPGKYKTMILLAAWCALRFGELAELRRKDIDLRNGVIRVRRGVVRLSGGNTIIDSPKSEAGIRDVAIPPHLVPILRDHIDNYATWGRDGLLFPAKDGTSPLAPTTLYNAFHPARAKIGRPDLRFHDLRHTGAVLAASTGATLAELMSRLGHSTPSAAMRYQHAAEGRDAIIARKLSALAEAN